MKHLKDYSGTVYGGLSQLLLDFCNAKNITISSKLLSVQNLERFDFALWREILTDLDFTLGQPALGLEIAKYIQPKHLGILAYIALSCNDLEETLTHYHHFHRLVFDGSPLKVEKSHNFISIRWDSMPINLTTQMTDEIAIAIMIEFFKHFMSFDRIVLHEIHFKHAAPKDVFAYEQYFRCNVRFSQPKTQILIPQQELKKPLKQSDQTLQRILMQQAQTLLEKLPSTTQIDERLQQAILDSLQQNKHQIEHIAEKMNVSVRQLQRYLQQQNTTFQQRMQNIRFVLAQQYLKEQHLTLQDIALLLGYSEQSAFQRAFKQWSNLTPLEWKKINHN